MSTLSVLVLLFNYHTSLGSTVNGSVPVASRPSALPGADPATGASTAAAATYDGQAVMTPYGAVQVQITVADGKVTAAQALQAPMADGHDQEINSRAVPVYNGEVIDVQSAQIDVVSGATLTWGGYTASLQSALDQAHL
ncbi:FMN-binding protein [Tessaracoccus antarcticus]|nr:FMN-binding protein [Tessaracoccus antarcticus]